MKKIALILMSCIFIFALIGCEGFLKPTPVANPVCPKEGSFLCAQSEKAGVQLETVYSFIYDSVAIATIADVVEQKEVCDFEKKIADWYESVYPVSYTSIISEVASQLKLIKDPKKAALIQGILNKHLNLYKNAQIISKADDEIIRMGHYQFRLDMGCD